MNEILKDLEEMGLVDFSPDNPSKARISRKGIDYLTHIYEENPQIYILFFIHFDSMHRIVKEVENENTRGIL